MFPRPLDILGNIFKLSRNISKSSINYPVIPKYYKYIDKLYLSVLTSGKSKITGGTRKKKNNIN